MIFVVSLGWAEQVQETSIQTGVAGSDVRAEVREDRTDLADLRRDPQLESIRWVELSWVSSLWSGRPAGQGGGGGTKTPVMVPTRPSNRMTWVIYVLASLGCREGFL